MVKLRRNKLVKKISSISMIMMCFLFIFQICALTAGASGITFSVSTIIPDNQTDSSKTYFDLQMKPGDEQTLEIELKNASEEEIKVAVDINSATTNSSGVVEYGSREVERDSTLLFDLKDIVKTEDIVVIPPESTYTLELNVEMPATEYDGVLAGGISLWEIESEEEEAEDDGIAIQNKYAYVVGIVLRETDSTVMPQLELERVFANQINARNVISANIHNVMPMYMNKMEVEAEITKKGSEDVLYSEHKLEMQMAPNSNFDFPVPLNGERMKAGEYTIHMTAKSMDEEWSWSKDFVITDEEAKAFNATDVSIEPEDYTWVFIAIGTAVLLIVFIIMIIIRSKKKNKKLQAQLEAVLSSKQA